MTHPTDEELDALVQDLRPMNGCNEFDRAVEAITALHAKLAEAWAAVKLTAEISEKAFARTALDRMLRAEREKALREAADRTLGLATGHECRRAIFAMIEGGKP